MDLRPYERPPRDRGWDVLLVGGPAGSGKSRLARLLSRTYAVPLLEVDDVVTALKAMTTPSQQPALHRWDVLADPSALDVAQIVDLHLATCAALHDGLAAVIADHLAFRAPVVIEGDYLTPALGAASSYAGEHADGRVRAVFVHEPDLGQLVANLLAREPGHGEQVRRAEVSRAFGHWLAHESAVAGTTLVAARPWPTLVDRAMALIDRRATLAP